jgi:hypothetical protein
MEVATNRKQQVATDLIKGALAGATATWVMGKATSWMYDMESTDVRQWEEAARSGKSAYVVAAQKAADVGGVELSNEIMNPALGFTPGPTAFPWQTHARGLGGHLVFGVVNEVMLEDLDRVA